MFGHKTPSYFSNGHGKIHLFLSVFRLCDQCGNAMEKNCAEWGHLLLRLLVSAAPKVRNQAFDSVQKWAPVFAGNKECLRACTSVLKKVGHISNLYLSLIHI